MTVCANASRVLHNKLMCITSQYMCMHVLTFGLSRHSVGCLAGTSSEALMYITCHHGLLATEEQLEQTRQDICDDERYCSGARRVRGE